MNKNFVFPPPVSTNTPSNQLDIPSEPPSATLSPNSILEFGRKVTNIDLRSPLDGGSEDEISGGGHQRFPPNFSVNEDTPRSSGEFYSLANSTTETLISDYDGRFTPSGGRLLRSGHSRRHSLLAVGTRPPEALMMGYAQVAGSFILDGSLVHTAQFEEVKRKGVVGTQGGGGVVGLETGKNDGKLLSGFGWGSFGGAIGSLLGGNNMSSIAEMKTVASM